MVIQRSATNSKKRETRGIEDHGNNVKAKRDATRREAKDLTLVEEAEFEEPFAGRLACEPAPMEVS